MPTSFGATGMIGRTMDPRAFLNRVGEELAKIDPREVKTLADWIWDVYQAGRFVFVIGNGGSGSNASHFCEDMGKGTLDKKDFDNDAKRRLKILSLTDNTPYILAWGNDEGFDRVFVEQLKNLASAGDSPVAMSVAVNIPHILPAVVGAKTNDLKTFGCTGYSGGKLRTMADAGLHVALDDMGIVESIHLTAFHWVVDDLYRRISM